MVTARVRNDGCGSILALCEAKKIVAMGSSTSLSVNITVKPKRKKNKTITLLRIGSLNSYRTFKKAYVICADFMASARTCFSFAVIPLFLFFSQRNLNIQLTFDL